MVEDIEDIELVEIKEEEENKPDHFEKYMKQVKEKQREDEFDPKMLDYIIDNKSSLRLEHIKEIKNEHTRIYEMSIFLKETYKLDFPDEFYEWIARDILGLKYKRWEIEDMKRQYRIKKKREMRKIEEDRKKKQVNQVNQKRNRKHKNIKPKGMIRTVNNENPFVLKF